MIAIRADVKDGTRLPQSEPIDDKSNKRGDADTTQHRRREVRRSGSMQWNAFSWPITIFLSYVHLLLAKCAHFGEGSSQEIHLKSTSYGVYTLVEEVHPPPSWYSTLRTWLLDPLGQGWTKELLDDMRYLFGNALTCYETAPRAFIGWLMLEVLHSLLGSLNVYLLGLLLDEAQTAVQGNQLDTQNVLAKGFAVVLSQLLTDQAYQWRIRVARTARSAASSRFRDVMVQANIRLDVLSAEDPANQSALDTIGSSSGGSVVWDQISCIVQLITLGTRAISDAFILLSFSRSEASGMIVLPIAFIKVALESRGAYWQLPKRSYTFVDNPEMQKMIKLERLARRYRKSVINDGLQEYILNDHRAARQKLELVDDIDISADWWKELDYRRRGKASFVPVLAKAVLEHLSEIVVLLRFARTGGPFPIKSITLFIQQANSLIWRVQSMDYQFKEVMKNRNALKAVHNALQIPLTRPDGVIKYPTALSTTAYKAGMKVEFRNVNFTYPKTTELVLKDLSFTVKPGQLCVIVGENGSGKSTTVNLLNNTYPPTSGEILVDDLNVHEYRAATLRKSQAILDQDYERYPFTLRENIAFGLAEHMDDEERIRTAAKLGGADSFIQKLPKQYEEEVKLTEFSSYPYSSLEGTEKDGPLRSQIKRIENGVELSGGQWQRLAVSRNFMRAHENENARLLCFDEPSSALDPEAEFELFENLRKYSGQKTLIFITHRFGHLTKHADLILCMKDGSIVEHGAHADLLKKEGGMYARMYHMQARAFEDTTSTGI